MSGLSPSTRGGAGGSTGLDEWWAVRGALDAASLEEMLSTDAPEELCCPITMTLFVEPVVAPSGETYSKATVARFENSCDPATRERIQDVTKLPPNRAISRQVNTYIQKRLGVFTDRLRAYASSASDEGAKGGTGANSLDELTTSLSTILRVIQVRPLVRSLVTRR